VDDARLRFLFGAVPPAASYADEDGRLTLLAADRRGPDPLRAIVANHILDDDPPETWRAAVRMLEAGLPRHDVMDQLVIALRPLINAALADRTPADETSTNEARFSEEDYIEGLDRLPVPSPADAIAHYVALAREARVIPVDELEQRVADWIGLPLDDPIAESLLFIVDRELYEVGDGPLTMLASDLVVHVPALVDGCVLTHRLSPIEQAEDHLDLEPDLAAFGRLLEPRVGGVALVRDLGRWSGPSGWLADLPAGGLLAVRAAEDGELVLDALSREPDASPGLVAALRSCYDAESDEPGLPVHGEELIAGLLHRDASAFAQPRPPLMDLAVAAGLQRRGGQFAHDPSVWTREEHIERLSRMMGRLGPDAQPAMEAYENLAEDALDPSALRAALDLMDDPGILTVVVDEFLGSDEEPQRVRELVELADRLVTVAGRSARAPIAAVVAAIAAERDRRPLDAESHLRGAARLAPDWDFVADRLAWYESDRGDAVAALMLWDAIGAPADVPEVAELRAFAGATSRDMGRNEPCWCGSGRKFKQCHRGRPERAPLPERVGWLVRKAIAYVERRGGLTGSIAPYLLARHPDLDDVAEPDPLVMDVALVEGGIFEQFVADRGPLLPDDELLLAQAWLLVERSLYEVTAVERGQGVSIRDLRTGDRLDVRDRAFSRGAAVGDLVCTRAVPDGTGLQFVGVPFAVGPGHERHVMELLDDGDGIGLLEWVAARAADSQLVSADGDELMLCETVATVPDGAAEVLDQLLERTESGWVWSAPGDGDVVRMTAFVGLDGNRLVASTITERRMDDLLALLDDSFSEIEMVSQTRERPDLDAPWLEGPSPVPLDPAAIEDVQQQMERRWCDEPVPALGGLRPRDAVDDPTRRNDVARLIASFPEIDPGSGPFGLRPDRLRELLGLR
jgi:hypothetical protein